MGLVDSANNSASSTSPNATLAGTPSDGEFIVAVLMAASATVADITAANGFTVAVEHDKASSNPTVAIAYKEASSEGGATITPFAIAGGDFWELVLYVFDDAMDASPLDKTNSDEGSGESAQPGTTSTLTQADEIAIVGTATASTWTSPSIDSGFTESDSLNRIIAGYKITSATTALNPTTSWTTSRNFATAIATFKIDAGATVEPTQLAVAPTLTAPTVNLDDLDYANPGRLAVSPTLTAPTVDVVDPGEPPAVAEVAATGFVDGTGPDLDAAELRRITRRIAAAGKGFLIVTSATRPDHGEVDIVAGQHIYETDTSRIARSDGTAWSYVGHVDGPVCYLTGTTEVEFIEAQAALVTVPFGVTFSAPPPLFVAGIRAGSNLDITANVVSTTATAVNLRLYLNATGSVASSVPAVHWFVAGTLAG